MTDLSQVYQIIYDESLMEQIAPIRRAFAILKQELQRVVPDDHHLAAALAGLDEPQEHCEQAIFDKLRGKAS